MRQAIQRLNNQSSRSFHWQNTLFIEDGPKARSRHILHDEKVLVRAGEELEYPYDVRMIELGLDVRFPPESRSYFISYRFGGRHWPDAFHHRFTRQRDVPRAVDNAHAAPSEFSSDNVVADRAANHGINARARRLYESTVT